jgi:hypothetical protein
MHDSQITDFSRSPPKKNDIAAFNSIMKDRDSSKVIGGGAASVTTFQTADVKKKAINFGEMSMDNSSQNKKTVSKDAPTIGNPLLMRMDMQAKRAKSGMRSQSGAETLSRISKGKLTSKSGRSGHSYRSGSRRSGRSYTTEDYEEMQVEQIEIEIDKTMALL